MPEPKTIDYVKKLRDMEIAPPQGEPIWKIHPIGTRVAQIGFDMQRVHGLTDSETFALIACALAEVANSMEKREFDRAMREPMKSILISKDVLSV